MSSVTINRSAKALTQGTKLPKYTGVIIHAGQSDSGSNIDYSAGNTSGYVLELDHPFGTQSMAYDILARLKLRNVQYQPFEATGAIVDPAIEIGDSVVADGVTAIVHSIKNKHTNQMVSSVAAPYDEEVDHEFTYVPRTVRQFKRESAYARARLTVNEKAIVAEVSRATASEGELSSKLSVAADAILAEVTRATSAESQLSGRISITAGSIISEVTRAKGVEGTLGSRITQTENSIATEITRATTAEGSLSSRITQTESSISTEITRATTAEGTLSSRIDQRLDSITFTVSSSNGSSTFTIKDGSTTLSTKTLDLTVSSVNISGKLTASQIDVDELNALGATVGGWSLNNTTIYRTVANQYRTLFRAPTSIDSSTTAIVVQAYEDTDWSTKFSVTYGGKVTAKNVDISGKITATSGTIGGVSISGGKLTGIKGGSGGNISPDTIDETNVTPAIVMDLGHAANYGAATAQDTSVFPSYFTCGRLYVKGGNISCTSGSGMIYCNGITSYGNSISVGSTSASWKTAEVRTPTGTMTIKYLGN